MLSGRDILLFLIIGCQLGFVPPMTGVPVAARTDSRNRQRIDARCDVFAGRNQMAMRVRSCLDPFVRAICACNIAFILRSLWRRKV